MIAVRYSSGSLPPDGATPTRSVVGSSGSASVSVLTTGTSLTRPGTWSPATVPARVESITATVGDCA